MQRHARSQPRLPVLEPGATLAGHDVLQIADGGVQASPRLQAACAVGVYLTERQPQEVLPGWKRHDEAQSAPRVGERPRFDASTAQAQQEVADLIERLDGSRRVVDGGRQRSYRDIDEQADCVLRVLLERAFDAELNRALQAPLVDCGAPANDPQY